MKKILPVLVIISFLTALMVPMIASAQKVPPECCKLKRSLTDVDIKCTAGAVVGAYVMSQGTEPGECPYGAVASGSVTDVWGMCCLLNTIYSITDWIFVFLVALAALFVIIGAVTIMTAAGAPEKVTSGRNYILFAIIGLVVGFLSKAIPAIVKIII